MDCQIHTYFDRVYLVRADNQFDYLRTLVKLYKLKIKVKVVNSFYSAVKDARNKGFGKVLILNSNKLIFQDDFHGKFNSWISELPNEINESWKILHLGVNIEPNGDLIKGCYYHPNSFNGNFATGVRHCLYEYLLENEEAPLSNIYQKEYKNSIIAYPSLIIQDTTSCGSNLSLFKEELYLRPMYRHLALVTVIICAYNSESTIAVSIQSIQEQTYNYIEIIVVDDCSSDKTYEIAGKMASTDPRIIVLRNKTNIGPYSSRNRALRIAQGEFITFHDADDYSLDTRIEKQVIALLEYDVLFTSCLIIRSHLPNFEIILSQEGGKEKTHSQILMNKVEKLRTHKVNNGSYKYCCRNILGMVTPLYRREIFEKIGLFWELRCIADAEYCERVLYHYMNPPLFFKGNESVVTYLSKTDHIPGIYYKVNEVLYISEEMNTENITNKYRDKKAYLEKLRKDWRKKLVGEYDYQYPRL